MAILRPKEKPPRSAAPRADAPNDGAARPGVRRPAKWDEAGGGFPPERMTKADARPERPIPADRTIALVGMMGAGKSAIGRQIAQRLGQPFIDADHEIERAAGLSIPEIFDQYGEAHFRDGERRVIARLLDGPPCVLATGGGAFMQEETRALLQEKAVTVWLNADFDVLWERVSRRSHRPLLQTPDPQRTLKDLIDARYPVYAEAQVTVPSDRLPKEATAQRVLDALADHFGTATCEEDRR